MIRNNPLPPELSADLNEVNPDTLFRCFSPNPAAAFIAADILDFCYVEIDGNKTSYVFDDPLGIGPEKLDAYYKKTLPPVQAALVMDIRGLLARESGRRREFNR